MSADLSDLLAPETFGGTPQEALDAAIAKFTASLQADDDEPLL